MCASADHQILTSVLGGRATGGRVDPGRGGVKTIVICPLLGPRKLPGGGGGRAREGRRGRGEEGVSKWLGHMAICDSKVGPWREITLFANRGLEGPEGRTEKGNLVWLHAPPLPAMGPLSEDSDPKGQVGLNPLCFPPLPQVLSPLLQAAGHFQPLLG